MGMCRECNGTGRQYVERGSSLCFTCPDCEGEGYLPECDVCGEEYNGEYCENCFAMCAECGEVCRIDDMTDGLCEECAAVVSEKTENSRNVSVPAQK